MIALIMQRSSHGVWVTIDIYAAKSLALGYYVNLTVL